MGNKVVLVVDVVEANVEELEVDSEVATALVDEVVNVVVEVVVAVEVMEGDQIIMIMVLIKIMDSTITPQDILPTVPIQVLLVDTTTTKVRQLVEQAMVVDKVDMAMLKVATMVVKDGVVTLVTDTNPISAGVTLGNHIGIKWLSRCT